MVNVLFHERLRNHEFTKFFMGHYPQLIFLPHNNPVFDYGCGGFFVLLHDYQSLESMATRAPVCSRVEEARKQVSSKGSVILLVWMNVAEPSLEVLSWLNLDCGVARGGRVVLCWSLEEVAQFVEALATASTSSVAYRPAQGIQGNAAMSPSVTDNGRTPFEVTMRAFTQTPQFLTETDITRVVNRHKTVADLLLNFSPENVKDIPGVSTKKAQRLHDVFHAPFQTTLPTVLDFLPRDTMEGGPRLVASGLATNPPTDSVSTMGDRYGGEERGGPSTAVQDVLEKIRQKEDAVDTDEDAPVPPSTVLAPPGS